MRKIKLCVVLCVAVMSVSMIGCGGQTSNKETTTEEMAMVTNPVVEYKSVEELKAAVGFTPLELTLSQISGMEMTVIQKIDSDMAEVGYTSTSGNKLSTYTVRTAKGTGDTTGVNGVTYTSKTINEKKVNTGKSSDLYVAYWTDGTYSYTLYGNTKAVDETAFNTILEGLVK